MFKRKMLLGAGVVVLLAIAVTSYSHEGPMGFGGFGFGGFEFGGPHPGPPPFMMLLKSANLTDGQKTKVHEILKSSRGEMEPLFDQLHSLHQQMANKLLTPGAVTVDDLTPLQQQATQIHEQIGHNMLSTAIQIRNLLTPEQLARVAQTHQKLESLHAQMEELMKE